MQLEEDGGASTIQTDRLETSGLWHHAPTGGTRNPQQSRKSLELILLIINVYDGNTTLTMIH